MRTTEIIYTLTCNKSKKTYTIREYQGKELVAKYRTNNQGSEYREDWTENDIKYFLRTSGNYFRVK